MPTNLLDQIKLELTSEKSALSNTLRKAKVLASQIRLDELKDWIKYELEGYPNKDKLPEYRKMKAQNTGTLLGTVSEHGYQRPIANVQPPACG